MELTNEVVIVEDDEVVFENLVYFLNTKSFKRQTSNVWNYFTKIEDFTSQFPISIQKVCSQTNIPLRDRDCLYIKS